MNRPLPRAVLIWLLALAACLAVIWRTHFTADMSAFLPQRPSAGQQLLVDQIKDGSLSRLLLIGIEGGEAPVRAHLSRALAMRMQAGGDFSGVQNGAPESFARDREILFANRYLLSPAVTAERFGVAGLRQAIGDSIDLLASPAGLMLKDLLASDPTGEMMELLGLLGTGGGPATTHDVWASRDGRRAILMAQTAAPGADTDAQERTLARLRADFAAAQAAIRDSTTRLLVSGTPVFSVDTRATIRGEVERLAIISTLAISALLLFIYRSVTALALGLLPVLTGALAGIAAVSLGFGSVHGLTIGFGTTLIGEAVDYSIYYFVQGRAGDRAERDWLARFWPTIRLGVLTSLCGFAALLFSGFPGLAQLGLYSIAGLAAAAVTTRFVLPQLCPATFSVRDTAPLGQSLARLLDRLARARRAGSLLVIVLAAVAAAIVFQYRGTLWHTGLSGLSPMPEAALKLNESLRADLGAPDQRYLIAVAAPEREAVLEAAERVAARLPALVERGVITGFETPTRFLPSAATQQARRAALPARAELQARLHAALAGLPLRADKLVPFVAAVDAAAQQPLLTADALRGSTLALAVDAMLLKNAQGWTALLPLHAPTTGANAYHIDPAAVAEVIAAAPGQALFVDLVGESDNLYADYLHEAILLSLSGFLVIIALLGAALRSPARLLRVLLPLLAAVLVVMAGLALAGEKLTLLHLVGLLLIVAVGSNYALFFDHDSRDSDIEPRTLASLAIANLTTVAGFGVLAFSKVPVLHAIGITVGPGAVLALLFAALLSGRADTEART